MEIANAIAITLGALGALMAAFATLQGHRGQREASKASHTLEERQFAWDIQQDTITDLRSQNEDMRKRQGLSDQRILDLERDLKECREGRYHLEVQYGMLSKQFETLSELVKRDEDEGPTAR